MSVTGCISEVSRIWRDSAAVHRIRFPSERWESGAPTSVNSLHDRNPFAITNGGVFGSMLSIPILNPPQVRILEMHATKQRAMVMFDGSIQARPVMYLAFSYDHCVIDGREAVSFLVRVKECIESPERMLLDA